MRPGRDFERLRDDVRQDDGQRHGNEAHTTRHDVHVVRMRLKNGTNVTLDRSVDTVQRCYCYEFNDSEFNYLRSIYRIFGVDMDAHE